MLGAVLPGNEQVELREFPVPEPGHGQVLVRMRASGLCGSDLRAIYHEHRGSGAERYRGCIAGHEPAGQIEEVGPGVGGGFRRGRSNRRRFGSGQAGVGQEGGCGARIVGRRTRPGGDPRLAETKRAYDLFDGGSTGKVVIEWT